MATRSFAETADLRDRYARFVLETSATVLALSRVAGRPATLSVPRGG